MLTHDGDELIPHTFHQVWVGPDSFPKEFEEYQLSWRRHHPEWDFRFWSEENLPANLRRPEAYDRDRIPAERSDIIRLEVLWRFGGVYIDTDMECRRPIDSLLAGVEIFTVYLKPGRVTNTIIGSAPGHPLLDRALSKLKPQDSSGRFNKSASGPHFLDALVKNYRGVTIFPAEFFYPRTPDEREVAYAVHHAARSWKNRDEWRETALLAEQRLERAQAELQQVRRAHEQTQREYDELKSELTFPRGRREQASKPAGDRAATAATLAEGSPPRPRWRILSFLRSRV